MIAYYHCQQMPTRCKQYASTPNIIWYHVPIFLRHIQGVGTCFCFNSEALSPSLACSYFMTTSQQKLMPTPCKQYTSTPNIIWYHVPTFLRHIQDVGTCFCFNSEALSPSLACSYFMTTSQQK